MINIWKPPSNPNIYMDLSMFDFSQCKERMMRPSYVMNNVSYVSQSHLKLDMMNYTRSVVLLTSSTTREHFSPIVNILSDVGKNLNIIFIDKECNIYYVDIVIYLPKNCLVFEMTNFEMQSFFQCRYPAKIE